MLDRSRIRAVLFDLDGTLADTDDDYISRAAQYLAPLKFLFPGSDPKRLLRRALMASENTLNFLLTVPDRVGLDDELEGLANWLQRLRGHGAPGHFSLIPGVEAMLAQLAGRYPLAVVTSRNKRGTDAFLSQYGLTDHFRAVAFSQTAPRIKPHPAPVLWAAQVLGVPAEDCLMVGDTTLDIIAGRSAGAQTVGVLCWFGERPELERAGADLILESTAELATGVLGKA